MSVYSSIAVAAANLLIGTLTLAAAPQQSVSVPLPPLAPKSANECIAYEKEVQRVRDTVDKWHTQCLDSFKGKPLHPASNGCSQEACAIYHNADQLGESNGKLCFDKVERFKKEEQENERRAEEARRLQEEARQKAEQERREAEAQRLRQEQQRYQKELAEAQLRRDQIERARQDAVRRQQQFEQELRRKQQEENNRKIQDNLTKLTGEFQKPPTVTDATIKDALARAGFDEMGRCASAACLAAMSSIPQNMTADEFAVWAEETRHHGWDDPVSVLICPGCAGDFKADGFGFEDHASFNVRIVEEDSKPAQMRRAPNPGQYVEPRTNYFPPPTLREPDKYKNLSPRMADATNFTGAAASLSKAGQEWIQDFGDGLGLREELTQRANAELKMLPPGTGAIIRAVSDSKGIWSSHVAATGRTYEEAMRNYTAVPRYEARGARERYIWVKRVP